MRMRCVIRGEVELLGFYLLVTPGCCPLASLITVLFITYCYNFGCSKCKSKLLSVHCLSLLEEGLSSVAPTKVASSIVVLYFCNSVSDLSCKRN